MKILMVNNRLKVYGGEGTYMTSVGDELIRQGHDVQYFGLRDEDGFHGNRYSIYASKSVNPIKLLRNRSNAKQFAKILDAFEPDIIHANLIYFTLTPSILTEAAKRKIPVIQTIHDGKIVCPSYQLFVSSQDRPCTDCIEGNYFHCVSNRCHKNSLLFSLIACAEASYNRRRGYYDLIDRFVFPSVFMRDLHVKAGVPAEKTCVLRNFSRISKRTVVSKAKERYVLFFGRIVKIKGIEVLARVADMLPDVKFVFAGVGDMESILRDRPNCQLVGFKSGKELEDLIAGAVCTVFPSLLYENCPMSIQESLALGTPAIGADIGGIPELIEDGTDGYVVQSGDAPEMAERINRIYGDDKLAAKLAENCLQINRLQDVEEYSKTLLACYQELLP